MWSPEPGTQAVLTVLMIVFLILNFIGVGLRVFVRVVIKGSFGYDDWAMIAGLVGFCGMCGTLFATMIYGFGATVMRPDIDAIKAAQSLVAFQLVYVVAAYLTKISVALVLFRIASAETVIRRILLVSIGVVTIFAVATFLGLALQCRPLSLAWGVGTGTCVEAKVITNIAYAFSACDIASGWLYALLPVAMLWNVKLSPRIKISIMILLGLSVSSSIATLVRLKYVVDLGAVGSGDPGMPMRMLDSIIWSTLEIALAIFAASLAALRPLFKFITGKGESTGGGNTYELSNKQRSRDRMNPAIRLDDTKDCHSDTGSQEFILHQGYETPANKVTPGAIRKHTRVEVTRFPQDH
ncbi:putative Integral membrane protein [Seiridium unicorne]|uniref:Integral membrane protein n=1 Tax=Seiridium unicorne TaxID=138068 RepID=A0ABR2V8S8_9PEZI